MSDFGFVMIAFAALFVVQVCQRVKYAHADSEGALDRVIALSELMIDLSVSSSHFTAQLGRSLQRRVGQVRQPSCRSEDNTAVQETHMEEHTVVDPQIPVPIPEEAIEPIPPQGVFADTVLNESTIWDPTAWLTDFLNDAGEGSFA